MVLECITKPFGGLRLPFFITTGRENMLFQYTVERVVRGERRYLHYEKEYLTCMDAQQHAKVLTLKWLSDCTYSQLINAGIVSTKTVVFDELRRDVVSAIFDAEQLNELLNEADRN